MFNMKKLIPLIFILFCFLNCAPTKYVQLFETKSNNTELVDNKYVYENESVKISYSFWQEKGLMNFEIYNKTNKPIYVDWKKSAFIENSNKLNYWSDEEISKSKSNTNSYSSHLFLGNSPNSFTSSNTFTTTNVYKPERITSIPPNTKYSNYKYNILPLKYYPIDKKTEAKIVQLNSSPKKETKVYEKDFSSETSPLRFRNYLAISTSEDFKNEFFIDNNFYISSVKEMHKDHFSYYQKDENSNFNARDEENKYITLLPFFKSTSFFIIINSEKSIKNRIK